MKNRPWFRDFDGWWYVTVKVDGQRVQKKLVRGKENEEEAFKAYHRLALEMGEADVSDLQMIELGDLFLDHARQHNDPQTFKWYEWFLQSFADAYQGSVRDLKPLHVTRWITRKKWGQSTGRQAITCVKRVINWAIGEGIINESPLRKLTKPPMARREQLVSADRHEAICEKTDDAFRTFLFALRQTGARPGEIRTVTAEMVNLDAGIWVLKKHKTAKRTGKPRIIYLTPEMVELSRRLMRENPSGPLFLNARGKPWTVNAVRCRMRRLRKKLKLPKGTVAYSYRHTFITDGLQKGVPIAEMAELCGHVDTKMISDFYSHLDQRTDHLRQAARRVSDV